MQAQSHRGRAFSWLVGTFKVPGRGLFEQHIPARSTPLVVGSHSRELLSELGYDEAEIVRLIDWGMVQHWHNASGLSGL